MNALRETLLLTDSQVLAESTILLLNPELSERELYVLSKTHSRSSLNQYEVDMLLSYDRHHRVWEKDVPPINTAELKCTVTED